MKIKTVWNNGSCIDEQACVFVWAMRLTQTFKYAFMKVRNL